LLPLNQVDFRKGKRTMDNIYVLNNLINRKFKEKLKKKGWILMVLFMDRKATFDSVSRNVVAMKSRIWNKRGFDKENKRDIEKKTKNRVRVRSREGESFWIVKKVRQV